jgi:hypothetical protein
MFGAAKLGTAPKGTISQNFRTGHRFPVRNVSQTAANSPIYYSLFHTAEDTAESWLSSAVDTTKSNKSEAASSLAVSGVC